MMPWMTTSVLIGGTAAVLLVGMLGIIAIRTFSMQHPRYAAQLRATLVVFSGFLLMALWMAGALAGYWGVVPLLVMGLWSIRRAVEDTVAGALIFVSRPIEEGDLLEVGGVHGEVVKVGVRALVLRSTDAADVRIPYHLVLSGPLMNHHHATADIPIEVDLPLQHGTPAAQLAQAAMCAATSPYASLHKRPETYLQTGEHGAAAWIRVRGYVFDSTFAEAFRSHIVESWLELGSGDTADG